MKKNIFSVSVVGSLIVVFVATWSVLAQEELEIFPVNDSPSSQLEEKYFQFALQDSPTEIKAQHQPLAPDCTIDNCLFLPLLNKKPEIVAPAVLHKTACDVDSTITALNGNAPIDLGEFQRRLLFGIIANGYEGSQYETYYIIDGQERLNFNTAGTIDTNNFVIFSVALVNGGTSFAPMCENILPAGTYTVRFLIDRIVVQESTAILR